IGMRNTVLGVDRFGDFVMSSQIYSNARDLARFGMLYQQNGVWNGERILSEEWIEFVRTPVPLKMGIPQRYGGHWWLPADDLAGEFPEACTATGSWGQYVIVIPSRELVIVRRGMDYAGDRLDPTRLALEVVKAFPQ
ncbi:MAG TPA: serine hydrolase, partial [Saprospiraceae bacterium]|nr:serine hydrolase [Saprospiraceae bacterium]